ncbi:MAG TPA: hypothetical protein VFJ95_01215 [Gammaproteobacteria bacterium]|nr:hypothetical protein [Gammaproteobacteria bacterium]
MNAPADPQFAVRIRESFSRQKAMGPIGARVYARDGKHVASMQQTLMMLADTPDTHE